MAFRFRTWSVVRVPTRITVFRHSSRVHRSLLYRCHFSRIRPPAGPPMPSQFAATARDAHNAKGPFIRCLKLSTIAALGLAHASSLALQLPLLLAVGIWRFIWLSLLVLAAVFVTHDEACRCGSRLVEGIFKAFLLDSSLPYDSNVVMLIAMLDALGEESLFRATILTLVPHPLWGVACQACAVFAYHLMLRRGRESRGPFEIWIPAVAAADSFGFSLAFWYGGLCCSWFCHTLFIKAMDYMCRYARDRGELGSEGGQKGTPRVAQLDGKKGKKVR